MELIKAIYKKFMTGFSYIIPLAVVGGVFLTLYDKLDQVLLFDIGSAATFLIYPILAGFIAHSISDKPGFILGLLAGVVSIFSGGGFLSATLLGFLSGYIVVIFNYLFKRMPYGIKGLNPIFIYPILGSVILFFAIQGFEFTIFPIEEFISSTYERLNKIVILISAGVLGFMMAYDLGGPINKIAYVIGVLSVLGGKASLLVPAIMIAGMMPPLVIASSALIFRNKYSIEEQVVAKNNWLFGLSFITEGAISFVKKNKETKIVILISSMTVAILTVLFDVSSLVVHGGILSIPFMKNALTFLLVLISSTLFFGFILGLILPKT